MSDERLQRAISDITKIRETRAVNMRGGKRYTMVSDRVEAVRRSFGSGLSIETEILQFDINLPAARGELASTVVMRATISTDGIVRATGHASEVWGSSQVNATSALENAETSAIGRALAAFGVHGGEFASANELDAVVRKESVVVIREEVPARDESSQAPPTELLEEFKVPEKITPDMVLGKPNAASQVVETVGLITEFVEENGWDSLKEFWSNNTIFMEHLQNHHAPVYERLHSFFMSKKPKRK